MGELLVATVCCFWAFYLLSRYLAGPLDSVVYSAVLAHLTPGIYVAYAAGVLAPVAVALLLSAAVTLPPAQTALTALYLRVHQERGT